LQNLCVNNWQFALLRTPAEGAVGVRPFLEAYLVDLLIILKNSYRMVGPQPPIALPG